ncbi:hypothetical protein LKW31_14395 [Pantoea agglomerans]|uniref:hypothetical protein n=1 Tax=Enterobacter agglomerans TaxID=549 RepID=UPI001E4EF2BE|nr:hypothetical protein [Pantoea agglomerans]UEG73549.1 hypothetical protein LKW31_14395 [Pantoea agglomerans]
MKCLFKKSAVATVLFIVATSVQAESVDFEAMDSDTIVVGATAEKITLKVTGYKYMAPQSNAIAGVKLGSFAASTNDTTGQIAVSYGPEHSAQVISNLLTGNIYNENGHSISTYLDLSSFKATIINIDGSDWLVSPATSKSVNGYLLSNGQNDLSAGIYPVTLRAALYIP